MADIEVFGADTGVNRKFLPLALVGAGVLAYLFLRPKPAATPASSYSVPEADVEFSRLTLQAMDQLNQLNASTAIEQRMIDTQFQLQAGLNPGLLRQCVPYDQWFSMSAPSRDGVDQQVRQGKLFKIPTAKGFCFTPTQIGIRGNEPPVRQQISRNFFTSKETVTGPAGSFQPNILDVGAPGINSVADTIAQLYASHYAVQMGGTPVPNRQQRTGPYTPQPYDPGVNPYPDQIPNYPTPTYPNNQVNPGLIWVDAGTDPRPGGYNVSGTRQYGISPVNVIWGEGISG